MAHLRSSVSGSTVGFDESRSLLVLPVGGTLDLYLVAGEDLTPDLASNKAAFRERPPTRNEKASPVLSAWEREVGFRVFTFTGIRLGEDTFNAYQPNTRRPWIAPLTIQVTADKDRRQAGNQPKGELTITAALQAELSAMHFREALVRLAEDQMNSAIGRQTKGGFGVYDCPATLPDPKRAGETVPFNWCGAWVQWLYRRVAEVKYGKLSKQNPFEDNYDTLASPQKAIGFALHRPDKLTMIEFSGSDPNGWAWPKQRVNGKEVPDSPALTATYKALTPVVGPPRRGDICLVRENNSPKTGWKHVCLVVTAPDASGQFHTFDGNSDGSYRVETKSKSGCIGVGRHNVNETAGGVKKYVFIAVNLPDDEKYVQKALPASLLG